MLKKIRVFVSIILFAFITLYFLDFAGFLPANLDYLTKIQFIPALLALNMFIVIAWIVATVIFGRVYCSSVCPMGIYQDLVAWLSKKIVKKKKYTYSRAKNTLRWSVLGATIICFVFGFTFLLGLLDPYGAYGRIATHIFRSAYIAGNNLLETIFTSFNNYTFYKVSFYVISVFSTTVALVTLLIIGILAWKNGRTYCNTICPVGTALGLLSKYALFKIQFVDEHCNSCGLCGGKCKASCIDSVNKQIDHSRCVTCFNCLESCNRNAMKYAFVGPRHRKVARAIPAFTYQKGTPDESKRRFLSATLLTGVAVGTMLAKKVSATVLSDAGLKTRTPVAPPGALSFDHLRQKCISCHLCVSQCPSHVIKPAFMEYGLGGIMQPILYFDLGFCNYDCTVCGDVCPSGAIISLNKKKKNQTQIGQVVFVRQNCIVVTDNRHCGACSQHCPTEAISMISYRDGLSIPFTKTEICVGCGACEYVCPATPSKAIYVEGVARQNIIGL